MPKGGGESEDQKKLSEQQSKLLQEQQDSLDRQKKEHTDRELDFVNRLQGQASTPAGAPAPSGLSSSLTGTDGNTFGMSGLFGGSSTIG
tara:strand:+ start:465 stop:731 length:267 start_codon:yes stop_codon:yes gene_type:complete